MEVKDTNAARGVGATSETTTPAMINPAETSALTKAGIAAEDSQVEFPKGKPSPPEAEQAKPPRFAGDGHYPETKYLEGFTPIRLELTELAKYWFREYLDTRLWWDEEVASDCVSTKPLKHMGFCNLRIEALEEALGKEAVDQAIAEVVEEAKVDPRLSVLWEKKPEGADAPEADQGK